MRKIIFAEGEYFHFYNRGVDKREIFTDKKEKDRFLSLLYVANSFDNVRLNNTRNWSLKRAFDDIKRSGLVSIGAWCMMPNHFHLLIKSKDPESTSKFMSKISIAYTMYFNKKHNRRGSLFESTFKAKHIDSDVYLKYLFSYIHLNPIGIIDNGWKKKEITDKKIAIEFLHTYEYSSLKDYTSQEKRVVSKIIDREAFPKYRLDFDTMISEWLDYSECSES